MDNKGHVAINIGGSGGSAGGSGNALDVVLAREEALHRFRDINWATYTRYGRAPRSRWMQFLLPVYCVSIQCGSCESDALCIYDMLYTLSNTSVPAASRSRSSRSLRSRRSRRSQSLVRQRMAMCVLLAQSLRLLAVQRRTCVCRVRSFPLSNPRSCCSSRRTQSTTSSSVRTRLTTLESSTVMSDRRTHSLSYVTDSGKVLASALLKLLKNVTEPTVIKYTLARMEELLPGARPAYPTA